jgi:mediator of RNA polymerase II transcription subunit 17
MGSIPNDFPISLRSWPSKQNDLKTGLPTLIQRINLERGGFREISEESLKQEIANVVAAGTSSNGASDDEEEAEEENEPDRLKEVMTVREEMLGHVEYATI